MNVEGIQRAACGGVVGTRPGIAAAGPSEARGPGATSLVRDGVPGA